MVRKKRDRVGLLEKIVSETVGLGLASLDAQDEVTTGRHVRVSGGELVNFGSCSYLGLELDPRLIDSAIEMTRAHGIQFCSSRLYLSNPLYTQFEELLEEIFELPVVVTATTTLGHLAALPVLVGEDDALLLDHQVHSSVQLASRYVGSSGAKVELVPHNDLERLEARVEALAREHRSVWYLADGIYSMFGDRAPIPELNAMLDRHEQMRLYVDDAHGMSWCGPRGVGSVLESGPLHPRAILTTGLGKGFGTGGGVVIVPDRALRDRIRLCGPTMIFSGPLQPAVLGAAIASARIHLTPEIKTLQSELRERVEFTTGLIRERDLPLVSPPDTPVGFLATGPIRVCQNLCRRLIDDGLYVNPAHFPATPIRQSGLRFLVTRHHTFDDLERLVDAIDRHWLPAVCEAGASPESVCQRFGLEAPVAPSIAGAPVAPVVEPEKPAAAFVVESAASIAQLDAEEWDRLLGSRGCLGSTALSLFESVFGPEASPENRWAFRYYVLRDASGDPVLATVFTAALWKADMLAPAKVSEEVEVLRADKPDYLTQRVFAQGCLLSEGDHLWLRDPADSKAGRSAIQQLLELVREDSQRLGCSMLVMRDVPESEAALEALYEEEGLIRNPGPDRLVLHSVPPTDEALMARLGRDHRRHHRQSVTPYNETFEIEVLGHGAAALDTEKRQRLHALYEAVRGQSLELNTYAVPESLWAAVTESPDWELVALRPKGEPDSTVCGFFVAYTKNQAYVPLIAGLDYSYVANQGLYRQVLRQTVARARARGHGSIEFGFGASLEKRRFGARPSRSNLFVELDDHFAVDAIDQITANNT